MRVVTLVLAVFTVMAVSAGTAEAAGCRRCAFGGLCLRGETLGRGRYPDRATCEFSATIAFGIGEPEPNTFTCRKPSGEVMSEGALQVQLIRLKGCKRRPRSPS